MPCSEPAKGIDQIALEVGAVLGLAVAIGAGEQIAVHDQRHGASHQFVQHVVLPVLRYARDAGHELRNHDRVAVAQHLHHFPWDDMGQREEAQPSGLARVASPAHEVADAGPLLEPGCQAAQEGLPFLARRRRHDEVAQRAVHLTAQAADEGGDAPARFELAPFGDGRATREDVCVRALQAEEGGLQAELQQATGGTEVVVRRGGKQMDEPRVALDQGHEVALEGGAVGAEAQLDPPEQRLMGAEDGLDRHGFEPGVRGCECAWGWCDGRVGRCHGWISAALWERGRMEDPFFGTRASLACRNGGKVAGLSTSACGCRVGVGLSHRGVPQRTWHRGHKRGQARVASVLLEQLAKGARAHGGAFTANRIEVLAAASRAQRNPKAPGLGDPQALCVRGQVECPVEADPVGWSIDGLVVPICRDERFDCAETHVVQPLEVGDHDGSLGSV